MHACAKHVLRSTPTMGLVAYEMQQLGVSVLQPDADFSIFHRNSETHAKSLSECVHRQKIQNAERVQNAFKERANTCRTRSMQMRMN